jgi:REP element-mobilizing transposase RayT
MSYKVLPPKHPAEVTMSIEQGLLLSANPLCRLIIESAMARAQALHPVTICHYLVEATHVHFLMVVEDPADIAGFAERFKTESAHYINTMLGRKKRTVWCEDYFAAPILTVSSVINKIAYIYTNPAKDALETSIDNYPGLSSWKAYRSGRHRKRCPRLHRPMIPFLPGQFYKTYTYKKHIKDLKARASTSHTLTISPDAWMDFFGVETKEDRSQLNDEVTALIKTQEQRFAAQRKLENKPVIGQAALGACHLNLDYTPKRSGEKMWCICDDKSLRASYIQWAKSIKTEAKRVYESWKKGDFIPSFPPGVFPPAMPKLANMTVLAADY